MNFSVPRRAGTRIASTVYATFGVCLMVGLLNIAQTTSAQWSMRPGIACDNGNTVHRFAEVNATRVNIRDLPTVFSNVLTQKSTPDKVTIVCEFGVWSRIDLTQVAAETWISSGLISLSDKQPVPPRMKVVYLGLITVGLLGIIISLYRPTWIRASIDIILQTQELPPHAKPLISVTPQYHPARDFIKH